MADGDASDIPVTTSGEILPENVIAYSDSEDSDTFEDALVDTEVGTGGQEDEKVLVTGSPVAPIADKCDHSEPMEEGNEISITTSSTAICHSFEELRLLETSSKNEGTTKIDEEDSNSSPSVNERLNQGLNDSENMPCDCGTTPPEDLGDLVEACTLQDNPPVHHLQNDSSDISVPTPNIITTDIEDRHVNVDSSPSPYSSHSPYGSHSPNISSSPNVGHPSYPEAHSTPVVPIVPTSTDHTHLVISPSNWSNDESNSSTQSRENSINQEDHAHSSSPSPTHNTTSNRTSGGIEGSFVMVDSSQLIDTSSYEESGIFYGAGLRNQNIVHQDHTPTPPPESADDVLTSEGVTDEMLQNIRRSTRPSNHSTEEERSIETTPPRIPTYSSMATASTIDPSFILEIERQAKVLSQELEDTIEGLQANLHAMSICALQSVTLQKDTVHATQQKVDESVKAMYTFLSKFNELQSRLQPIKDLGDQIYFAFPRADINENLKLLERVF